MNKELIFAFFLIIFTNAHSWVECTDYRGEVGTDNYEVEKCHGFPRAKGSFVFPTSQFGLDVGMDFRPNNAGTGARCQGDVSLGLQQNYRNGQIAQYTVGNTYTIAWPAKNHVAAICSNQYIPDTSLKLFMVPYDDANPQDPNNQAVFRQNQLPATFTSDPHVKDTIDFKGFQNCPGFCDNPDKVMCTGEFTIPAGTTAGRYTLQWYWAFNNANDLYATCWEADVLSGNGQPMPSPTSAATNPPVNTAQPGVWLPDLKATHFWDCDGMSCDATVLQPWDDNKYIAAPGYQPQDPSNHGGASYGERMWMVGAVSKKLNDLLGADDPCCGRVDTQMGGCGKCFMVRNPSAVNSDWTALVMKKSYCPPWTNGCEEGKAHLDIAVPGFDYLAASTSNKCGQKPGTQFASDVESATLGSWFNMYQNTQQAAHLCDNIPSVYRDSCKLFANWGWTSGNPTLEYQVVDCPDAFKAYAASQFGADGATLPTGGPSPTPIPTPLPTQTPGVASPMPTPLPTPVPTSSQSGSFCAINQCGCPPYNNGAFWCNDDNSPMAGDWCKQNENNCGTCSGIWCPGGDPTPPNQQCNPSEWQDNQSQNHFTADCSNVVALGELCAITHSNGFSGGKVICSAGSYVATPATCQNCCAAGSWMAPGTGVSVPHGSMGGYTPSTQVLDCPDGFSGTFTLECAKVANTYTVIHSDGFCVISCTEGAQRRFLQKGYDHGFSTALEQAQIGKGVYPVEGVSGSGSPVVVGGLVTALLIVCLSFGFYAMKKEEACFFAKGADVESLYGQKINEVQV